MLVSAGAHSSIRSAAQAMDADIIKVPADDQGRMTAAGLSSTIAGLDPAMAERIFAIVATSGTTNAGVIDDLRAVATAADEHGWWMHVDGAYGGAALVAPSVRPLFDGIERADSLIVDPHKWLFAPFDCCALLYRTPDIARAAHTQHAEYLDVLHDPADALVAPEWNASDYAHHLTRRARGLPFWFSLATHGTDAYMRAVETTLTVTRAAAERITEADHLELVLEPQLSVVMLRRIGWNHDDYQRWSNQMLAAGTAFVTPSAWNGETVLRLCIVNPLTTIDDIALILDSLR